MLLNGSHSDRTGERTLHCIVPCLILAPDIYRGELSAAAWVVVASLATSFICFQARCKARHWRFLRSFSPDGQLPRASPP